MATAIQKGKSVLRPRARLIKTIGEELISNDVVAVIELVKNSYDADSPIIIIEFEGNVEEVEIDKKKSELTLIKEDAIISIYDEGSGMSLDTIQTTWMEPATISKKGVKNSPKKSRRYTGEKGIGRFASAKLSAVLQIVTKVENDNEIVVDFNWNDFSNDDKYLDQVESNWEVRPPIVFKDRGTLLKLTSLNSDWNEDKFQSLKIALSRLINPVAPVDDFLIELKLPEEFSNYAGLVSSPDSINKPDYTVKGDVDESGTATITYISKKTNISNTTVKDLSKTLNPVRKPVCGKFNFEFRVWDREADSLDSLAKEVGSSVRNIRADLDQLSGISIYRDGFRVLPYGEPKNDWLRLNARRVNNPTLRISDNQVVGYISISLDTNPGLKDQSNREGIVDSPALTDLQEIVRSLINELEVRRYEERPRREDIEDSPRSLYQNFSISSLENAVTTKLPNDKEILELVETTKASIERGVQKVQEVLSRYRRLSTLGQLVDSILHDSSHFLHNIDAEVHLLMSQINQKAWLMDVSGFIANLKLKQNP